MQARLRQQCEDEKLSIIADYERQILELQSNSSTPPNSQFASKAHSLQASADWRLDVSKIKMCIKSNQFASVDLLSCIDSAVVKIENLLLRDQKMIQEQSDKYKQLKRRARDYQKYASDKLAKNKAERQRSEEYCRLVISDLLGRVTHELQLLEQNRVNVNRANDVAAGSTGVTSGSTLKLPIQPVASTPLQGSSVLNLPRRGSTFAEGIDDLQQQVNMYVRGLTNFNNVNK